jgi:hypothetical protein
MRTLQQISVKQAPAVDAPHDWNGAQIVRYANVVAIILVCYAVFYRIVLISSGWPGFNSDQGIIGLMARHIWLNGEHPLFNYGIYYQGPVEAYAAVPFFALFGSSVVTLRLALLPWIILFLVMVYVLGRISYGPIAGLFALAWLAIGPSIAIYRELLPIGGYHEMLALSGVIVLCAWMRLRLPERGPRGRRARIECLATYAILGAASGLGIWSYLLIAPLVLITVLALLLARPREMLSWSAGALVLGFVVAAGPYIHYNVTHQFVALSQALGASGNGDGVVEAHLVALPSQLGTALAIELPAIFGSPNVCSQTPGDASSYHWMAQLGSPGSLCTRVNQAFSLLILALFALAAWPLASAIRASWRDLRSRLRHVPRQLLYSPAAAIMLWRGLDAPVPEADARRSARLWLRGILLVNALVTLVAFVYSPVLGLPLDRARYLIPLYISAPLFFGALWETLRPAVVSVTRMRRWASAPAPGAQPGDIAFTGSRRAGRWRSLAFAAALTLTLLLVLSAIDGVSIASVSAGVPIGVPLAPWNADILAAFDAHHVRTFYTDRYDYCYTLAFESNERQVCAVAALEGLPASGSWTNRYTPYVTTVANDPHPAYLLLASSAEETAFAHGDLSSRGYIRILVGRYAIYYYGGAG